MEPTGDGQRMLIVDDDEALRMRLTRAMQSRGFDARSVGSTAEALHQLSVFRPDFAVVDLNMPGDSGLVFVRELVRSCPATRAVVVTGYGSITTAVEAIRDGAYNYLTKPADADQILAALSSQALQANPEGLSYKPQTLAEQEWDHIQRILADCGDNISEAARQLGIPRRTLQRKLKKRAP